MCLGGSAPKDNSGQIAAEQEAKRQATVQQDTGLVNDAFTKSFTPDYYNNITNSYENYYNPQLDQQYQNTLNSLTSQLGQQGILQSTEGNRQLGLLKQSYDTQKQTVANNAANAAASAKQNVASQQNTLLSQANQASDPTALASQTAASVGSINTQPTFSPLGSVFASLLGQGTNALSIQQGALPSSGTNFSTYVSPTAAAGSNGSSGNSGGSAHVVQ